VKARLNTLVLSATDLSNHLGCRHLTALEHAVARGERTRPKTFDPRLDTLRLRGLEHEKAYLTHLREQGIEVLELPEGGSEEAGLRATEEAMRHGVAAIAQAMLGDGRWHGRADVLLRVDRPSDLGPWSYEPLDTKLTRETKAGTILQLLVYAELLVSLQGVLPEQVAVVTPESLSEPERYRVAEYRAFANRVRRSLEESLREEPDTYPLPVPHCDVCRWQQECDARWRADDHVCLVAGVGRLHERELASRDVRTLAGFAALPLPFPWTPLRGSRETFERLREQARLQLASRESGRVIWERLPPEKGQGLTRLPEPSPGDLFLDLEGDPYAGDGGLEYLFGTVDVHGEYSARWAVNRKQERAAFEALVDELTGRWEKEPGFHVYHFGAYEPGALKRLMGRYATREDALDRLLRGERFVDLHRVVTQGLRVGVESYSIKKLEPAYGFVREMPLAEVGRSLRDVEKLLELGLASEIEDEVRQAVELYNRDDCVSTLRLRDWLERERAQAIAEGEDLPRPAPRTGEASESLTEERQRVQQAAERLLVGPFANPAEEEARRLLAHCLDFHRREDKVSWWEHFRLADLGEEKGYQEPCAISGLRFARRIEPEGRRRVPIDVYSFPPQEVDSRSRDAWIDRDRRLGTIEEIDFDQGLVRIRKTGETVDDHPRFVFLSSLVRKEALQESLLRLADWVLENGIDAPGRHRSARDLLLRRPPRSRTEADCGVLPIQGPPGSGKTYTAAQRIVELARQGRKVGVTAVSHKVIDNLLKAVLKADGALSCLQKVDEADRDSPIPRTKKNQEIDQRLRDGEIQAAGGTAWLWARPELEEAVDVLFVDEAGQMSLADVLAVSQAARNLVLLGDPQQLEQPIQGSHPEGTAIAALTHLLDGRPTLAAEAGLFLERTRRLHPEICAFTSEQFYDGRLLPLEGLERQALHAPAPFDRSGLFFLPVEHEGNQNHSEEEAEAIERLWCRWREAGAEWTDQRGVRRPLKEKHILIVTPYNAQTRLLCQRLPGFRIGTVDKFQGQEEPVAIYSMVSSSPEDAPRGMEFLYSRNRLNVATSRARCACVLVASPRLLEPECRSPRQMRLANALCDYVERAVTVRI
jgi:uncharacterized protein